MNFYRLFILFFVFFINGLATAVQARVFSFKDETFAAFFRGSYGLSQLGSSAFSESSGTATTQFDKSVTYDLSGELGVIFSLQEKVNIRLGFEVIRPQVLQGIVGRNASGTKYFDLNSTILIVNPEMTFEINVYRQPQSRLFVFAGAGISSLSIDNAYTMTSAGTSALGVGSHTEKIEASRVSATGGMGYEFQFADTVTAVLELGYRYLYVNEMKYKDAVTAITAPSAQKGDVVLNNSGTNRKLSLDSIYFGLSFRFYVPAF
ncbi:MAG: hypothetical protein D6797_06590 [Bdellovibrio sp.]|nr:MAG: hypothetical protein D6797_06590 [Bdellovibrio sp.]